MPLFVFLFNPLLAFLGAMKRLDAKFNGLVFVMFYALFGYAISFTLTSADSYRVGARFCQNITLTEQVFASYQEGGLTDVYLLFVFSLLRPFTANPKVAYLVLGTIMGILSFLSIRQLYKVWPYHRNKYFYLIVFFYFLVISFFNVNGVRFWTATAFYSFFVIQYLYFHKRWALFVVWLTPLFHFGFLIGIMAFYSFLIVRKIPIGIKPFFFVTFFTIIFSFVAPESIGGSLVSDTELTDNKALNNKAENYVKNDDNVKKAAVKAKSDQSLYRQANSAYTKLFGFISNIGIFIIFVHLYKKRKLIVQSDNQQVFLRFVLYMYVVGVLASIVIGSGVRFILVAMMMFYFWYASVTPNNLTTYWKKQTKWLILINFYSISFLIINSIRLVTPLFWIAPPLITIIDGIGFGPIDYVDN